MHPLFDVQTLTDDEILARIDRARNYLAFQTGLGRTPAIESISYMLDTLCGEQDRRRAELFDKSQVKPTGNIELGKLDD